eukprot:jgi/Ulvmu1/5486/UM023_0022.1
MSVAGVQAPRPAETAEPRGEVVFERGSLCESCNLERDPQACCERIQFFSSARAPPSWFDAVTLVGGFAAVIIIIIICCIHQFRQQTRQFQGRRGNRRRRGALRASTDGLSEDETFIVFVDLNKKQAFPIDELPESDSTSGSTAALPAPQSGTASAAAAAPAAAARAIPARGSRGGSRAAAAARRGQAVLRSTATVLCELPLRTGDAVSRRLAAARPRSTVAAPRSTEPMEAAPAQAAAAGAGPSVAVAMDGGAAADADINTERDRHEWFENVPLDAMPMIAVMPDAQLCLCQREVADTTPADSAPHSSAEGGAEPLPQPDGSTATGMHADAHSASVVAATDADAPRGRAQREGGDSSATFPDALGVPVRLGDLRALGLSGGSGAGEAAVGSQGDETLSGEEDGEEGGDEGEGEATPGMLYFFKAQVLQSDFEHVLPAEPAGPRLWQNGLLLGLSGWLSGSAGMVTARKGSWGALEGGAGEWDAAAADRSWKAALRGKSGVLGAGDGYGEGGEGAEGDGSRRGKGSSRVLEGVWLALAGRAGSRQVDAGEDADGGQEGEELRAMPARPAAVGGAAVQILSAV